MFEHLFRSRGTADVWTGAYEHKDDMLVDEVRNSYGRI